MAVLLIVYLFLGILTAWMRYRWVVNLVDAGAFALTTGWGVRAVWRRHRFRVAFPFIALVFVPIWGLLQLLLGWTVYEFETWNAVLHWGARLGVFWLAFELCQTRESQSVFCRLLFCCGFVTSLFALLQHFTAPNRVFWLFPVQYAAVGPFLNRDHYAVFVELILPMAFLGVLEKKRAIFANAAMAGVMYASVVGTGSRMGTILVTIEVLIVLFLALVPNVAPRGTIWRTLSLLTLSALLCVAVVGWQSLWYRFQDPDPFKGRRELLTSTLAMVRERPWAGFGLGTWPTVYPAYAVTDFGSGRFVNHAHNDWAEWTAEGGLPFLVLLLLLAAWSARSAVQYPWGVGVVAALLHSAVDFPMQRQALAVIAFSVLGVMSAAVAASDVPRAAGTCEQ